MRQAKRYLQTSRPSTRIINQRVQKIREAEEEFKRNHFTFCEKAKIGVDSEDAMVYLRGMLDNSADVKDECEEFIEEREKQHLEEENKVSAVTQKEEEKLRNTGLYIRRLAEVSIDERVAKDVCQKVQTLVEQNELSKANTVLMKMHVDRLDEVQQVLNQAWTQLLDLQESEEERNTMAEKIFTMRSTIQTAIANGVVFLEEYREATALEATTTMEKEVEGEPKYSTKTSLRPEKLKLPTFGGNVRTFAKFKKDFEKIVVPFYPEEFQQAYVMKESCLKGKAKGFVENIDDIKDMWSRLEAKYGDKVDLVDLVISELSEVQPMKANDDQKFIDFVDRLERGLLDLEAISARGELANAYTVN